jgi:hypothetical protein
MKPFSFNNPDFILLAEPLDNDLLAARIEETRNNPNR